MKVFKIKTTTPESERSGVGLGLIWKDYYIFALDFEAAYEKVKKKLDDKVKEKILSIDYECEVE